jgi:CRP-like cAMP-binding protein
MESDMLFAELKAKVDLTEQDYQKYCELFVPRSFKKNTHIFSPGDIADYIIFIKKGCIRVFTGDTRDTQRTIYFAEERWWTGDLFSMRNDQPTDQYFEAVEDCDTLIMSKDNWHYALRRFEWFATFHLSGHKNWLIKLNQQLEQLRTDPPAVNYARLLKERPRLVERIPPAYIANYLGIGTHELSKLQELVGKAG